MLSLYKTLVRPHVKYCTSAWSPYYENDRGLLAKVQRRYIKMIANMDGGECVRFDVPLDTL